MPYDRATLLPIVFMLGTGLSPAAIPASDTFSIRGTITDPSRAVIPKAKVTFQSKQFDTTLITNERGVYETNLPLGDYTMKAEFLGFRPYRRSLPSAF